MHNANVNTDFAKSNAATAKRQQRRQNLAPAESRLLRLFEGVPEEGRAGFFSLLETICRSCNWDADPAPVLRTLPADPSKVIDASALFVAVQSAGAIPLFGSKKLMLGADGRTWMLSSAAAPAEPCTERESMFINAALRAAGGV